MSGAPAIGIRAVSLEPDPGLLAGDPVNAAAAQLLPERVCRHFLMIPFAFDGTGVSLAMADPTARLGRDVAWTLTSETPSVFHAPADQIERAIDRVWAGLGHFEPRGRSAAAEAVPAAGPGGGSGAAIPGRLGALLAERGLISEVQLREALALQARSGDRLGEILRREMGLAEQALTEALAEQLRVPLIDPAGIEPPPEALALIPEAAQRERRCAPLAIDETALYVATFDPLDAETHAEIRELTELRIRTYLLTRSALEAFLRAIYPEEQTPGRAAADIGDPGMSSVRRLALAIAVAALTIGFVVSPEAGGVALAVILATLVIWVLSAWLRRRRSGSS